MLDELLLKIKSYNPNSDLEKISKAYNFTKECHEGQFRNSGEPYFIHPVAVANILADLYMDDATIIAGLMHDVLEDTEVTFKEMAEMFDEEIANLVNGVTKLKKIKYQSKQESQADNLRKMLLAMNSDIRVIIIKIADRLHNIRTLEYMKKAKQLEKAKETLEIYAPLAYRLGMSNVKWELEDLSLRYLEPEIYYDLAERVKKKRSEREKIINDIIDEITISLKEHNIQGEISGRPKSLYSIYKKMYKQNKSFDEIFDLTAVRIIVPTISDCYAVLGIVHSKWKPIPSRFKDYIAVPKPNMYQSLHTTILGEDAKIFEVQIRTERMDEIAEHGLAAHWRYKGVKAEGGMDNWLASIRSALEACNNLEVMDEFRSDLYEKEIYVFTPKGDLLKFPKGVTVLDFAYHIHSKIGNQCVRGKINGKNVSFRTELHSGDSVEILTSSTQKPNRDWLNICKSSRAKAKIRLALKETQVKDGLYAKELLERRFKNKKIEIEDSTMGQLIRKLGFKEVSEFYKQIADEKLDPNYVIEEYQKTYNHAHNLNQTKETESAENFEFENPTTEYLKKNDDVLVIDKNLKGLDFSLAKCCHPIYGDPVFGFVTVSGGIKIHREDCPNAPEMRKRFGYRVVKARWSGKGSSQYAITLRVIGNDDIGIVSNISNIISKDEKIVMRSINIDSNDGLFSGNLVVLLDDNSKLNMLIKKLRTVKGVKEVMRI